MHQTELTDDRLSRLEQRLKWLVAACLTLAVSLIATAGIALKITSVHAQEPPGILRVRGLVVEDAAGRARIVLGAPVPEGEGRRRTDPATGMIVLSETGADRVAVGYPTPAPQVGGKIAQRIGQQSGIVFNDSEGNERGGLGMLDNGTVSLGLDYPGREAVSLAVAPNAGFAGLTVNAASGSKSERAEMGVLTDGTSLLKLADTTGAERAMLMVQGEAPAKLLGISRRITSGFDVGVSWLNPRRSRHIVVKTGREFMNDLTKLKP